MAEFSAAHEQQVGNPSVRQKYRTLSDDEQRQIHRIKEDSAALLSFFDQCGNSREMSLAKTKVEEAVMWAVKHITA